MKKIVSLMALCMVLLGAVMMVTGCDKTPVSSVNPEELAEPVKGSVWQRTTQDGVPVSEEDKLYYCFHSDGYLYFAEHLDKPNQNTGARGKYVNDITAKTITLTFDKPGEKEVWPYTFEKDVLTLTIDDHGTLIKEEYKKVSKPTADEIKKLAK